MALTINGTTGIETNTDTGKIKVGIDDDLQISHSGSHSYIDATGTGDLYLRGGPNIRLTDLSDNKMILCQDGGETQLYHNGAQKLNTISTGINVTGNVKVDSGSGIDFSATAGPGSGSDTSELLDDYEEGTWTPGAEQGSLSYSTGRYTKIGRMVYASYEVTFDSSGSGGHQGITGLPMTVATGIFGVAKGYMNWNSDNGIIFHVDNAKIMFYAGSGSSANEASVAGNNFRGTAIYEV